MGAHVFCIVRHPVCRTVSEYRSNYGPGKPKRDGWELWLEHNPNSVGGEDAAAVHNMNRVRFECQTKTLTYFECQTSFCKRFECQTENLFFFCIFKYGSNVRLTASSVRLKTKITLTLEPWLPCLGTNQVASCSQKVIVLDYKVLHQKKNYPKNYKKSARHAISSPNLPPISLQSPPNL